jgi:hypothetical protein
MLTHFLVTHQEQLGLDDAQFARQLRLDPETWRSLRAGEVPYSAAIVARILLRFPNALPFVLEELRQREAALPLHAVERPQALPVAAPAVSSPSWPERSPIQPLEPLPVVSPALQPAILAKAA